LASQLPNERRETTEERDDRNLLELLQELRVAGLGVQVLFGFLLAIPFTNKFSQLSPDQHDLYVTTLLLAALAAMLLLAPVAFHRILFRQQQKEFLVRSANVLAILGLVTVALAVSATVALVLSYVMPGVLTVVITTVMLVLFAGLWFAFPLSRRR
jgi:Family of unknown function (DUF6328)